MQDIKLVTTKSLHMILPHIEQRFYKVPQTEKAGDYTVYDYTRVFCMFTCLSLVACMVQYNMYYTVCYMYMNSHTHTHTHRQAADYNL